MQSILKEGETCWRIAKAMDSARIRLMKLVQDADIHKRFRLYYPDNPARTPIYVHAKMMYADDRIMKIGSAKLNNRSMGYDTECDLIEAEDGQEALRLKIPPCLMLATENRHIFCCKPIAREESS